MEPKNNMEMQGYEPIPSAMIEANLEDDESEAEAKDVPEAEANDVPEAEAKDAPEAEAKDVPIAEAKDVPEAEAKAKDVPEPEANDQLNDINVNVDDDAPEPDREGNKVENIEAKKFELEESKDNVKEKSENKENNKEKANLESAEGAVGAKDARSDLPAGVKKERRHESQEEHDEEPEVEPSQEIDFIAENEPEIESDNEEQGSEEEGAEQGEYDSFGLNALFEMVTEQMQSLLIGPVQGGKTGAMFRSLVFLFHHGYTRFFIALRNSKADVVQTLARFDEFQADVLGGRVFETMYMGNKEDRFRIRLTREEPSLVFFLCNKSQTQNLHEELVMECTKSPDTLRCLLMLSFKPLVNLFV